MSGGVVVLVPKRRSAHGYLPRDRVSRRAIQENIFTFSSPQINSEGAAELEVVTVLAGSTVTFLKQHHNIKKSTKKPKISALFSANLTLGIFHSY